VEKLKEGYGGRNSITGRHTDRAKGLLIAGVVAAVLIIVVVAAAKSK
jgi:tetrahydromethanopterin S-methyltransferase subunit F